MKLVTLKSGIFSKYTKHFKMLKKFDHENVTFIYIKT